MRNLLADISKWQELLSKRDLALFLDYDGTLTEIASTPQEAVLSASMQDVLCKLSRLSSVKVAVISGRPTAQVRQMVGLDKIVYVGSHGMELKSFRGKMAFRKELKQIRCALQERVKGIPGVLIEDKPCSLAVHFRLAKRQGVVQHHVQEVCRAAVAKNRVVLLSGKKVLEILPPEAMDKGRAAEHLFKQWHRLLALPIVIGDDQTDESAFRKFKRTGLTVRVGSSRAVSAAKYSLRDVQEVKVFLKFLYSLRLEVLAD